MAKITYCLCNITNIITKYLKMIEKATTDVDFHQVTENQALLKVELQLECCYSNTRDERHSSSKPLLFQKNGTHICVPYLARQVSWS
jgi:hypothetical protein